MIRNTVKAVITADQPRGSVALALPALVVIAFLLYAGGFLWSSSFVVGDNRWFSLFDDAMISMRYAYNIANGDGFTWNPGERVEGFSNPGWTLLMALVHLVEQRPWLTSLYIQIISALLLAANIIITAALAMCIASRFGAVVAGVAAMAAAFYFPLNYFSLMGMETGALALFISVAILLLIRAEQTGRFSIGAWLFFSLAIFVRMDAVVPLVAIGAAAAFVYPANRRRYIRLTAVTLFLTLGAQTLLRWWYYDALLPNTWYLKMSQVPLTLRFGRGLWVTNRFLFNHLWPLYLALPFLLLYYVKNRKAAILKIQMFLKSPSMVLLVPVAGQIAYSTYVGGDVWERQIYANRFIVVVVPLMFSLVAQAVIAVLTYWSLFRRLISDYPRIATLLLGALLILQSNWHPGYEQARAEALLLRTSPEVSEAEDFVRLAKNLNQQLPDGTTLAIDRAGTLPYFMPDYRFYDVLGKMDKVIARQPSRTLGGDISTAFVPGHTKWLAAHTLGRLKPDVLILAVQIMSEDYQPWIDQYYQQVEMNKVFAEIYVRRVPPAGRK